jgi:hypothetical protein
MDISSTINVYFDPKIKEIGIDQETIKTGDFLRLKVLEILGDHRVSVDFGKFRANAEIKFPVVVGEELMAKVVETGRQFRLQVAHVDSEAANRAFGKFEFLSNEIFQRSQSEIKQVYHQLNNLSETHKLPPSIHQALDNIQRHFTALTLGENTAKLAADLKAYLEHSGFFFEKRIEDILKQLLESSAKFSTKRAIDSAEIKRLFSNDLKPNLLLLKDIFETRAATLTTVDAKNLTKLRAAVDALLADIGNQQSLAVKKQLHPDPFHVLALLLPLTQKEQTAELKVYYPKKGKAAAKNGFKISILLNMSHLGQIRTDLFLLNKDLTITFFVEDEINKNTLEKHYSEIKTSLQTWFDYIIIRSVISRKKIKEFHQEDWNISDDKRVNVRI